MNRKLISVTLVIVVIIILLAPFDVYFCFENNRVREELHESRVGEAYFVAHDIARKLLSFTDTFYRTIHDLNSTLRPENTQYNESKIYVITWKSNIIAANAENSWTDIQGDLRTLRTLASVNREIPFFNLSGFDAVLEAIREALGQAEWATMGKTSDEILNETPAFMWELYFQLGIDQVERSTDRSGMEGLAWSFDALESYWSAEAYYGRDNVPEHYTPPQTALEWTLANATALHRKLTQWNQYHNSTLQD